MKMKIITKPISSPGRAEKYPPPLMRFMRSNVGSRSRGRSRSSPMFVLRKRSAAIETQEPTSPKVTCMGQVRVKRSKQPGKRTRAPTKRRCKWIKNGCFCRRFEGKRLKPRSLKSVWCKWVLFFGGSFRRKSKIREDTLEKGSKFGDKSESFIQENESFVQEHEREREHEEEEEIDEAAKVFGSPSATPPKNALLLTRCRSAPYRSSSLASRFWGEEEIETEEAEAKTEQENRKENPTSGRESICRDSDQQSRRDPGTDENLSYFKEFEGPIDKIRERFLKYENIETVEEVVAVRPLILTRCKSEPARTGEKLDPQMSFWKKRRLGFT